MARQIETKHREIYRHIHEGIVTGAFGAGQRIPTEMELANEFDTSRVTVARALRDLQVQGFLIRRRGAGSFVRLREQIADSLFGLVTGNTPGLLAKISDAMIRKAHAGGFGLLSSKWPEGGLANLVPYAEELCGEYSNRKVAGVFMAPMELPEEEMSYNARVAEIFARKGIPVVLLDRDVYDLPRRSSFDLVGIDNFHAGYVLTEHLWSLGRRRIGFVSHSRTVSTVTLRIAGYQHCLASHGVVPSRDWVHRGETGSMEFVRQVLKQARPDGLVCANDHEAAQLIRTLAASGVRVPEEVAIVSIDDDQWATYLSTSLTTLRPPFAELGVAAIKMMIERLAEPRMPAREVCLACKLIVRKSCGAATTGELAGSAQSAAN